jgi:hypothetical protein
LATYRAYESYFTHKTHNKIMKKLGFASILLASTLTFSCQKLDIEEKVETIEQKVQPDYIKVGALTAVLPKDVSPELFKERSYEEFEVFFAKTYLGQKGAKVGGETPKIKMSAEEIVELMKEEMKKVPDLSQRPLKKDDLERLKKDFKEIKSEEDVRKNTGDVYDYYNTLVKSATYDIVAKRKDSKGGRIMKPNFLPWWFVADVLILYYGVSAIHSYNASWDACNRGEQLFGANPRDVLQDQRANAYLHATWNAFSVRNMILYGNSRSGALSAMRFFGTTFEKIDKRPWNSFPADNQAMFMDLHNNLLGRSYMATNTGWGFFGLRSMPSDNDISNFMYNRSQNSIYQPGNMQLMRYTLNGIYLGNPNYYDSWIWHHITNDDAEGFDTRPMVHILE